MSSNNKELDSFHCPICFEEFMEPPPIVVPCGHSICKTCLEKICGQATEFECPLCRKKCPVKANDLPKNYSLFDVREELKTKGTSAPADYLNLQDHIQKAVELAMKNLHLQPSPQALPSAAVAQPLQPPGTQDWSIGMKLEALDRKNPHLIAVATVTSVNPDGTVRFYFDGWSHNFDYTAPKDCTDIHPAGYCAHMGIALYPPKDYPYKFTWQQYLAETNSSTVPAHLFTRQQSTPIFSANSQELESIKRGNNWVIGMKLEAVDRQNPKMICVATVTELLGGRRVRIHFDGWTTKYDYVTVVSHKDLHPCGYCEFAGIGLHPPKNYGPNFTWRTYIQECLSIPVPYHLFNQAQTRGCPIHPVFRDSGLTPHNPNTANIAPHNPGIGASFPPPEPPSASYTNALLPYAPPHGEEDIKAHAQFHSASVTPSAPPAEPSDGESFAMENFEVTLHKLLLMEDDMGLGTQEKLRAAQSLASITLTLKNNTLLKYNADTTCRRILPFSARLFRDNDNSIVKAIIPAIKRIGLICFDKRFDSSYQRLVEECEIFGIYNRAVTLLMTSKDEDMIMQISTVLTSFSAFWKKELVKLPKFLQEIDRNFPLNVTVTTNFLIILCNLLNNDHEHIQYIIESGVLYRVVQYLNDDNENLNDRAVTALTNFCAFGSQNQKLLSIYFGCVRPLCKVLYSSNVNTVSYAAKILNTILTAATKQSPELKTKTLQTMEKFGGLEKMISLQNHDDSEISKAAKTFVKNHIH